MRYLSVCSGIEAASVAWGPLGWTPIAFSEVEAFPSAVLAHHYPSVPNWGDMTRYQEWPDADVDVLVGGTPCQSFSVAGLRKGLDDPRGNLMLTFGAIAKRYRPRWLVWENVPGVLSSNGGRDFGTFLGMLAELGYGFAYRVLDAQYVRVDSHPRAVPQRRRRVFVVGHLGDWRRAAAVLLERESLSGHPAPRREAGEGAAGGAEASTGSRRWPAEVGSTLNAHYGDKQGLEDHGAELFVAHSLRADGFDASGDGTGRGTPIVPALPFDTTQVTSKANRSHPKPGDPCHPLAAGAHPPAIAIQERAVSENPNAGPDGAGVRTDGAAYTLEARTQSQAVAFQSSQSGVRTDDVHATLDSNNGSRRHNGVILPTMAVRRLAPVECSRLQGFPDDYLTQVTYRGKCPPADGPMYKALGNSMATNVMRWIGLRVQMVEEIAREQKEAA